MPPTTPDPLALVEAAYRQHYETAAVRASVSFVGVEPIEILRYEQQVEQGDAVVTDYLSLGMSRYPMTEASAAVVDSVTAPRGELLLSVLDRPDDVWRKLAVLAAAPAVESAVYRVGARIDLGEPWCGGSRCTGAVVVDGPLLPIAVTGMSDIAVFRLLPATAVELAWARVHGTQALLDRWRGLGTEVRDLRRDSIPLT